jgi:hypothetical protein
MLECNGGIGLPGAAAEDRLIHDMEIAGGARAFRAEFAHQRMGGHHVVVDDQVEAGELSAQRFPVERMIFGDEILPEETVGVTPGRYAVLPEMDVVEGLVELVEHVHAA